MAEQTLKLAGEYDARALKATYRALAATYHPDAAEKHGFTVDAATQKMQEINEANDYLERLLAQWGPSLHCEAAPAPPEDPQHRGMSWAPPTPTAHAAYNPFEGSRPGAADRRNRQSTTKYYQSDPRYRAGAANARRRARQAQPGGPGESRYYNGEYESFSGKPHPEPKEDPAQPFPKWYLPLWRFFAIFPYRFVFLFAVCLLVNMSDPFGTSARIGFISFEDMLILLALVNLVKPFITSPLRAAMLWLVNLMRDAAWRIGKPKARK